MGYLFHRSHSGLALVPNYCCVLVHIHPQAWAKALVCHLVGLEPVGDYISYLFSLTWKSASHCWRWFWFWAGDTQGSTITPCLWRIHTLTGLGGLYWQLSDFWSWQSICLNLAHSGLLHSSYVPTLSLWLGSSAPAAEWFSIITVFIFYLAHSGPNDPWHSANHSPQKDPTKQASLELWPNWPKRLPLDNHIFLLIIHICIKRLWMFFD